MNIKRGFVNTPDGQIEYREIGEGKPIIFMHATPVSSAYFANYFSLFPKNRRLIAMTTIGYGESSKPHKPYTTIQEYAQSVQWFLDGLAIDNFDLFGTHTGGIIAIEVAINNQERIDHLILDEVGNYANPEGIELQSKIHSYYPAEENGGHLIKLWEKSGGNHEHADIKMITQKFIDTLIVNSADGCEIYGNMGWEGAGPYALCSYDSVENGAKIKVPTLLIYGTESKLLNVGKKISDALKTSLLVQLNTNKNISQGMFTHNQDPNKWMQAIMEFVSK
ncbi:MAG: Pimeloyl-ACP methyl ester carboxylesterase [Chloroflexi bacterium]|jgi:pimeloyl-ACP methyl ester carboxylesterase|nr:MAG: Pimeloyl-ACP methyl ester carboxylesterase [Chloroflexota bacterium]|tara:strand:+ start:1863 stop:2696 length:834 start_codon:yes stop_codon:yes gene_type:complete